MNLDTRNLLNVKGQVVIPQPIRKALGIFSDTKLHITIYGNSIRITPIKDVLYAGESESSYYSILSKTKGSWESDSIGSTAKREVELKASQKRKQSW